MRSRVIAAIIGFVICVFLCMLIFGIMRASATGIDDTEYSPEVTVYAPAPLEVVSTVQAPSGAPVHKLILVNYMEPETPDEPPEEEPVVSEEPVTESEPESPESAVSQYEQDLELLACIIYQEVGADAISDLTRYMVGDVVLNRVKDPRYPDTIEGVLTEKDQWGRNYYTGVVWPEWASDPYEKHAVERAYAIAADLLAGNHSYIYGHGYIFMAEFIQGEDVIFRDGCYFGKG